MRHSRLRDQQALKIGLVCPYNIFRGGGVQECVLAMQAELSQRGHQAKIITPLPRNTAHPQDDNILFVGTSTDVKSLFHTTAQISVNLDNALLRDMLAREQFDLLHFHEPWVPIMSRQLLSASSSVNVATFHAKLPETVMSKTIERVITPYTKSVMKHLHALTAVSESAAGYARSLTEQPVTIVPNGIDLKKYRPNHLRTASRAPMILYIGRLEKRKGLKYLLDAFAQYSARHPTAELVITGDGPDRKKLENYAANHNVPNVRFLGFVSEEQKLALLGEADLFCSPAPYGESFGIVLLEAMASGLPIIAANNPGYAAVLRERGLLSLIDPKDTDLFVHRLELMVGDSELRQLWRQWALGYVKQFDYAAVVDQYESVYRQATIAKSAQ
jgi:phosphatidylinositol alpha-mannosyltransferase